MLTMVAEQADWVQKIHGKSLDENLDKDAEMSKERKWTETLMTEQAEVVSRNSTHQIRQSETAAVKVTEFY